MKYNITIIESDDICDYFEDSAEGITYCGLERTEMDNIMELSFQQGFSVAICRYREEE